MRRTVGSFGIALVGPISSTRDLLRIISRRLEMDTKLILMELMIIVFLIKMILKGVLKLSKKMMSLCIVMVDVYSTIKTTTHAIMFVLELITILLTKTTTLTMYAAKFSSCHFGFDISLCGNHCT